MATKELNLAQVAEQLDAIAEAFIALAGTFRGTGAGGKGASGNGKASGKAGKPAKPAADEPEEVTEDDLRNALKALALSHGKDKMVEALATVGASKLDEVDESQYAELKATVDEYAAEEAEPADEPPAKPAKKTAPAKKSAKAKGPTLADVQEAAKALVEADKPAYLKLVKKLGKPSEMDESAYADAIEAYTAAMPEEEEEDLL